MLQVYPKPTSKPMKSLPFFFLVAILFWSPKVFAAEMAPRSPILLWPNGAPDEKGSISDEKLLPPRGSKPVDRISNVTAPTLTISRPSAELDTGAAVIVCPGGGYNILAHDLEGTEVVEWLNSLGVTGILLKYRVPRRADRAKHAAPLQDAQRAFGLVRRQAKRWGLDPGRIGILGFSAGGHLSAMASTQFETRSYPRVDANDDFSCRPDFTVLIYPAYLSSTENPLELSTELSVDENTPPSFLVQTQDDGVKVESSLAYYIALKRAGVPVEMHLYPSGGHGYGLRKSENPVSKWPDRCAEWLTSQGILTTE